MKTCLIIAFTILAFSSVATSSEAPERMALVEGGCFQRGLGGSQTREVCLNNFYMDKYEVTQKEFEHVMEENPSRFINCTNCPVEQVTWFEARNYCKAVDKRLPTEAEWEYAARGGGKKEGWAEIDNNSYLGKYAWYWDNSFDKTHQIRKPHPVGQKKQNNLDLHDMSGNVWEWVWDWYGKDYFKNSPKKNPKGPLSGKKRVLRGGSWKSSANNSRTAYRYKEEPDKRINIVGFRCAKTIAP